MSSESIPSDFDKTFKLQIIIGQIIEDTLFNWDNSKSKITIESFKRKTNCLVLIKIGKWNSKHHFLKCAMMVNHDQPEDLYKLKQLLSTLGTF